MNENGNEGQTIYTGGCGSGWGNLLGAGFGGFLGAALGNGGFFGDTIRHEGDADAGFVTAAYIPQQLT